MDIIWAIVHPIRAVEMIFCGALIDIGNICEQEAR